MTLALLTYMSARIAARALLVDVMPVVVTVRDPSDVDGISFWVKNEGRSTALNIEMHRVDDVARLAALSAGEQRLGVSAIESSRLPNGALVPKKPVTFLYEDAIGNRYKTECTVVATRNRPMYKTPVRRLGRWVSLRTR